MGPNETNGTQAGESGDGRPINANSQAQVARSPLSPTDTYAQLNRQWWEDQQGRYLPLQQLANDQVLDPATREGLRQEGIGAVSNSVDNSFNRASDRLETLRSRTNQQQSARSLAGNSRLDNLNRTATTVGARNAARDYLDQTELQAIGG